MYNSEKAKKYYEEHKQKYLERNRKRNDFLKKNQSLLSIPLTKKCFICNKEKNISEFHKNIVSKDGHAYKCKECYIKYNRLLWEKNKSKIIKRVSECNYNSNRIKLNKLPLEIVKEVLQNSFYFSEASKKLFPNDSYFEGKSHEVLKKYAEEHNIDISHFKKKFLLDYIWENKDTIFIKNSKRDRKVIKRLLLENGVVEDNCSICKMSPVWQNKKLVFHLDHINGDTYDNRIENLRLICPNCHSQTAEYAGRNKNKYKI